MTEVENNNIKKANFIEYLKQYNTYIVLFLLIFSFIFISPDFFTIVNLSNISRQYATLTMVAMGMLTVILTGGIDLSVGSMVALGSIIMTISLQNGYNVILSTIFTILMGLSAGTFTGLLVSKTKMPSFVASLAMMTIARGLSFMISGGYPLKLPAESIQTLGSGKIFGVPYLFFFVLLFVVVGFVILNKMSFGRIIIAIGSNEEAIYLSGIKVDIYKTAAYSISSLMAVTGGILAASRTGIGSPLFGQGMELDAIAACVIGGASLAGGNGSILKTVVGVIILALISNIMNLLSVPSYPQDIIKGAIIILAVLMQIYTSTKSK